MVYCYKSAFQILCAFFRSSIWINRAVASQKANIVHHRIRAGHPLRSHRSRIDAVGVEADAGHDIRPAFWSFKQRLRTANALKSWG